MSTKSKKGPKISCVVKLVVAAGSANPGPPIATSLGPRGVNLPDFCKRINEDTKDFEKGAPIPVVINVYTDRTFDYVMKCPPASYLIKKAIGIEKGSKMPRKEFAGKITVDQLRQIAKQKMKDSNTINEESFVNSLRGSAKSMGIEVCE